MFLEMKFTSGEDAVKTMEMTRMDLEYCIHLVDNVAVGFERIEFNSERSATGVKCCQTALHATEKSLLKS